MAQIGDVSIETYYEDLTGDGVKETIVVRKTVTFVYAFAPDRYDYDVVIEIVNGRNGEILFRSQAFETEAIGAVVTSGDFRIVREDEEPVRLTYTETVINTEHTGPEGAIMNVKRHVFQWNGRSIEEQVVTVYDFSPHEEDLEELKRIAMRVYDAILAKDVSVILDLIDWGNGIGWGADGSKTYKEVEEDLRSSEGDLYCWLFGCSDFEEKSIRDHLVDVNRDELQLEVRVRDWPFEGYAEVIYNWPGKPPDLWVVDLPNPQFRWQSDGWKFSTVFTE